MNDEYTLLHQRRDTSIFSKQRNNLGVGDAPDIEIDVMEGCR